MNKEPWLSEPNEHISRDKHTGYYIHVLRNKRMLNLRGYVGVSAKHPLYEKHYNDEALSDIKVHGGLTYSGVSVNNVVTNEELWWFGFDCAHYGDFIPGMARFGHSEAENVYRDFDWVTNECINLAAQLYALRKPTWRDRLRAWKRSFLKLFKNSKAMVLSENRSDQ